MPEIIILYLKVKFIYFCKKKQFSFILKSLDKEKIKLLMRYDYNKLIIQYLRKNHKVVSFLLDFKRLFTLKYIFYLKI